MLGVEACGNSHNNNESASSVNIARTFFIRGLATGGRGNPRLTMSVAIPSWGTADSAAGRLRWCVAPIAIPRSPSAPLAPKSRTTAGERAATDETIAGKRACVPPELRVENDHIRRRFHASRASEMRPSKKNRASFGCAACFRPQNSSQLRATCADAR